MDNVGSKVLYLLFYISFHHSVAYFLLLFPVCIAFVLFYYVLLSLSLYCMVLYFVNYIATLVLIATEIKFNIIIINVPLTEIVTGLSFILLLSCSPD